MAITYPLSLPTSPGFVSASFGGQSSVSSTESPFTFDTQAQKNQGQRWGIDVTLPPMVRADAEEWIAFLMKLNGREGTFLIGDPAGKTARGVATGTPLVKGAAQTGNSLITDGWTINQTGIMKAGDYLQSGTGATSKLHKVLNDADSDGIGDATFDIWPEITTALADNAPLVVSNTVGLFRLTTNEMRWSIDTVKTYGLAFQATEVI